ncbi:GSCFA domain-containing protein [Sphingomonas sabuli]|uniref:GSCFA domain-containing protein n=1 Tax=Sphingomonas sabuli TaxID=2764186 RepID=A0A7G9L597_9SPHN|nr:GSCFA domain-containing protein [Sphingomonas sabuli]QNM83796.1 GSCFA domain-containing protein [Sphingomonas sabuli]
MSDHPYRALPDKHFWRRSVASRDVARVDPVGIFDLQITPKTKVATAGSCFAQHISRHLKQTGFNHYVAEPGHPLLTPSVRARHNYGLFSARFGNIYTARQLLQLFDRAYGRFTPAEEAWRKGPITFVDPFRPTAQPNGFVSPEEMLADRAGHLAAVRTMFETLDIFVFTLGLTECWRSRADGAVFPLCPGVDGGTFDPGRYEYYNQTVDDVTADLAAFRDRLAEVNPAAQIVLTVSPVPLAATAEPGGHVLSATTYSKSVLRVASETVRQRFANVHYFPAYEIVTGGFNRGAYFARDLRNVTEAGVEHVMRLFMAHATDGAAAAGKRRGKTRSAEDDYLKLSRAMIEVECDEAMLDRR